MSWRNVIIAKPAKLSLKQGQLCIRQEEEVTVPLEDICVIVAESGQATVTSSLLNALAERNIPLISCDRSHMPSGIFLSFSQHSRFLKVLKMQLEQTLPFRKNCWRLIVVRKIKNQALCLEKLGKNGAVELHSLASEVRSGDVTNREGVAAKVYFDNYMPSVTRQENTTVNASLNYGYSIMRGAVARSLTSYGFLPAVGLHHHSELNSFNLADDFMEVLRPVVDLWTAENVKERDSFDIKCRAALVELLFSDVVIDFKRQSVMRAIDIMCSSFSAAVRANAPERLKLIELYCG